MPPSLARFLDWNPLTGVIEGVQRVVVRNQWPEWEGLVYPAIFLALSLLLSRLVYRRVASTLADQL